MRAHGIRGEVSMRVITDYPERLSTLETLYIGGQHQPYTIQQMRPHKDGLLLRLAGVADRSDAELLRQQMVYIHIEDAIPLEEGEFYLFELEGIRVVTDEGEELGTFKDFIETGANDVYIITHPERGEILLPAIPEVIMKVDLDARVMTVHLLDGLIE